MEILKEEILKTYRERSKATRGDDGKCSQCGENVPPGNFCDQCGATFITEEMIKRGELFLPLSID